MGSITDLLSAGSGESGSLSGGSATGNITDTIAETIGELVQLLRRGAVAGGATLGMSLVAFGETGWRVPEAG